MQRERITDHILVFRSDQYAQVTAGLVVTPEHAVLIDTLLYPEETMRIRHYVEEGLGLSIRYVINTHYHADHSIGTCLFPEAQVIAHRTCRDLLDTRGRDSLRGMQENAIEFSQVELVLPHIIFQDHMRLEIADTTFSLWHSPGHSPDSIVCLVEEEAVLFAADTMMPIPFFVDGSLGDLQQSLASLYDGDFENIVQGHGDIILRGEVPEKLASDLEYLQRLQEAVSPRLDQEPDQLANGISLLDCGKSPALLGGLVQQLHRQNIHALAKELRGATEQKTATNETDEVEGKEGKEVWHQKRLI